jgi:uncharacterized cupin superfamily protein
VADWHVLNLRDAEWRHAGGRGAVGVALDDFEGERGPHQFGFNTFVLEPGDAMGMYHREADQEAFLVVAGEAVLVVEGEERPLRTWDFVHCPPGTNHTIIGAGDTPCVVVAVGAREHDLLAFPADEVARSHGASVAADTTDGGVAYADVPGRAPTPYRDGWLPD